MAKYIDLGKMVLIEAQTQIERDTNKFFITFKTLPKIGEVVNTDMIVSTNQFSDGFMAIQNKDRWVKLKDSTRDWRIETFYKELLQFKELIESNEWALYDNAIANSCFGGLAHQVVNALTTNPVYSGVIPKLIEA